MTRTIPLLLLLACAKPVPPREPAEREAPAAATEPVPLLLSALDAKDGAVVALAAEALLRHPPASLAGGFVLGVGLAHSPDDRVQLAVIRAMGTRLLEPEARALLGEMARGATGANPRVRGYAALALAESPDPQARAVLVALGAAAPHSGSYVGVIAAAGRAGFPGAHLALSDAMTTTTLPLEPAFFAAFSDYSLPWAHAMRAAEPQARPAIACGMLVSGASGAEATATRLLHAPGPADRDDMADVLADCPAPLAAHVLRTSSDRTAMLARIARGELGPEAAASFLDTPEWADAVHALAARPDEAAHALLRPWAAVRGDAEREVVAAALAFTALPGDDTLLTSLATDASLRTRVAVAAARLTAP